MTDLDLDAIEARAAAATSGPWRWVNRSVDGRLDDWFLGHDVDGPTDAMCGQFARWQDADFIAHAREDIPALVAEVRALRARRESDETA